MINNIRERKYDFVRVFNAYFKILSRLQKKLLFFCKKKEDPVLDYIFREKKNEILAILRVLRSRPTTKDRVG